MCFSLSSDLSWKWFDVTLVTYHLMMSVLSFLKYNYKPIITITIFIYIYIISVVCYGTVKLWLWDKAYCGSSFACACVCERESDIVELNAVAPIAALISRLFLACVLATSSSKYWSYMINKALQQHIVI